VKIEIKKLNETIDLNDIVAIAAKIFCAILLMTVIKYQSISLFIRSSSTIILIAGLILPKLIRHPLFWMTIAGFNLAHLFTNYFSSANHQFLYVYYSFIFAITFMHKEEEQEKFLKDSFKYMFIVVMGLATLHKGLSYFYWQGGLLYDYILRGGILKYLFSTLDPNFNSITLENSQKIELFIGSYKSIGQQLGLREPVSWAREFARVLSISVIAMEAILTIMIASSKFKSIKHWLFLVFIITTFFFRMENLFLSTLSLTGLVLCPKENDSITKSYLIIILYFLSLSVLNLMPGFYY